jgi:hypothetical protein
VEPHVASSIAGIAFAQPVHQQARRHCSKQASAVRRRIAALPHVLRFDAALELRTFSGRCASRPAARRDTPNLL